MRHLVWCPQLFKRKSIYSSKVKKWTSDRLMTQVSWATYRIIPQQNSVTASVIICVIYHLNSVLWLLLADKQSRDSQSIFGLHVYQNRHKSAAGSFSKEQSFIFMYSEHWLLILLQQTLKTLPFNCFLSFNLSVAGQIPSYCISGL